MRVPTFAYWKDMIAPRKSEGLFDLADLFNTSISLAGKPGKEVAEFVDDKTYIDGIDQVGMLLADNGQSARRSRPYTLNQYWAGLRIDEFKFVWTGEIEDGIVQRGAVGGFSGFIFTDAGSGVLFNLYTNPQEDVNIGIRHIPMYVPLGSAAVQYMQDLLRYPPQFKVGFLTNNPPIYDLLPGARVLLERFRQEGLGRYPRAE